MNITSVADIIPGFVFRGPVIDQPSGQVYVVQASNINGSSLLLDFASLKRIDDAPERANAYVEPYDVLIAARGSYTIGFKAAVLPESRLPVLASSSVYILRPRTKQILPQYLALYINSKRGQTQLAQFLVGGVTRAVRRADIENFELPVPDLTAQKLLVELHGNTQEQADLLRRRTEINTNVFEGALRIAAKEL